MRGSGELLRLRSLRARPFPAQPGPRTAAGATCGPSAGQLLRSGTHTPHTHPPPPPRRFQGLSRVLELRRSATKRSPRAQGRPDPNHSPRFASMPGEVTSPVPALLPQPLRTLLPSLPVPPERRPRTARRGDPPRRAPAAGQGPSAHRHQELQRAHIVPLGLEQLVEDADAQAELLLQVLAALAPAFPSALLRHGAPGPALPRRRGQAQQKTPPSYIAGPAPAGRRQPQPLLSALRSGPGHAAGEEPARGFPSGRGRGPEEASGHWFPARPAGGEAGQLGSSAGLDIHQALCVHVTPAPSPSAAARGSAAGRLRASRSLRRGATRGSPQRSHGSVPARGDPAAGLAGGGSAATEPLHRPLPQLPTTRLWELVCGTNPRGDAPPTGPPQRGVRPAHTDSTVYSRGRKVLLRYGGGWFVETRGSGIPRS